MKLFSSPHRRYNPLTNEWILVSPHRTQRPWLGQVEKLPPESLPAYDPDCYLCPGNARAGGKRNPEYKQTFVFDNDFAALLPEISRRPRGTFAGPTENIYQNGLLRAESERGICRVVCFSPRHDLGLPRMDLAAIRCVVDVWAEQTLDLGGRDYINYVQVFENKGALMGASNPHPHCQVWSGEHVPTEPAKELRSTSAYREEHRTCLLCDYLEIESKAEERLVLQNDYFVVMVPFWAVWPYETLVLGRRHVGALPDLNNLERDALADAVKRLTTLYDNLFDVSFPYSMGFHQSPTDGVAHPGMHLHAHYYPPLLRSATVRKFMVGYEMLANPQRDLTAEAAAARLRELGGGLDR